MKVVVTGATSKSRFEATPDGAVAVDRDGEQRKFGSDQPAASSGVARSSES